MKVTLSDAAELKKTFFIIDGKVIMGSHHQHAHLYDTMVAKGKANKLIPYYYNPRGALYKDSEVFVIVGPEELSIPQQKKLARVLNLTNYMYGTSPHYSEHQILEFIDNEEYDVEEDDWMRKDETHYAVDYFKQQIAQF